MKLPNNIENLEVLVNSLWHEVVEVSDDNILLKGGLEINCKEIKDFKYKDSKPPLYSEVIDLTNSLNEVLSDLKVSTQGEYEARTSYALYKEQVKKEDAERSEVEKRNKENFNYYRDIIIKISDIYDCEPEDLVVLSNRAHRDSIEHKKIVNMLRAMLGDE